MSYGGKVHRACIHVKIRHCCKAAEIMKLAAAAVKFIECVLGRIYHVVGRVGGGKGCHPCKGNRSAAGYGCGHEL